jgi:hypothetical protein
MGRQQLNIKKFSFFVQKKFSVFVLIFRITACNAMSKNQQKWKCFFPYHFYGTQNKEQFYIQIFAIFDVKKCIFSKLSSNLRCKLLLLLYFDYLQSGLVGICCLLTVFEKSFWYFFKIFKILF